MKSILIIFGCVALLLPSIINAKTLLKYANDVDEMSVAGGVINNVFKPSKYGMLGKGGFSFVYEGVLGPIKKKIAMKFSKDVDEAEQEYKIYTYLGAINNTNIESYGIPAVYYYGPWKGTEVVMLGFSLLEAIPKKFLDNDVNTLILMRDFILSSKYMHSKGVRHDDIKFENLMIRKGRLFLIDFNISSKMNVKSQAGTLAYLPRRALYGERYPKDDWESLLYSLMSKHGILLPWDGLQLFYGLCMMKSNTTETIERIEAFESKQLRKVLRPWAKHIFDDGGEFQSTGQNSDEIEEVLEDEGDSDPNTFYYANDKKRFPDYNYWYKFIDNEIKKSSLPKPVTFTWLKPEQRTEAIDYLKKHPSPDITKIADPKDIVYSKIKYPNVDLNKFTRAYDNWKATSVQSFSCAEPSYGSDKPGPSESYSSDEYLCSG